MLNKATVLCCSRNVCVYECKYGDVRKSDVSECNIRLGDIKSYK